MTKQASPTISKVDLVAVYRQALAENMSLDKVDQKLTKLWKRTQVVDKVEAQETKTYETKLKKKLPAIVRYGAFLLPLAFISAGLFLLGNAVLPIAGYYVEKVQVLAQGQLTSPIPPEDVIDIIPSVIAEASSGLVAGADENTLEAGPVILDGQLDYTNLANWFGEAGLPSIVGEAQAATDSQVYYIDIPSVNIEQAKVVIGGTDLNSSLIQYPGTADPGNLGAPVIFGHSVLRQFYNPSIKNPRRYVSIFSTIMTLKNGDDIFVTRDNVKYHYKVKDKTEVKPEDVYILTQNYDKRDLKLVTCTPEGTYLRRGVITAQLVEST